MAKIYEVQFKESIKRTKTVESFRFISEEKIDFKAGQFLQILFDKENPNNKELNKYLSFSCSPNKDYIEVTKRISQSLFSLRLKSLKKDEFISIKAPLGNCVFDENYKRISFLAGGIGITPVISILEYIQEKNIDTDALLLYFNRTEDDVAFKDNLDNIAKNNHLIKVVYLITDAPTSSKDFIFSCLDKAFLEKYKEELKSRIIYIFGPPKMVELSKKICLEIGVNLENIKIESFMGY